MCDRKQKTAATSVRCCRRIKATQTCKDLNQKKRVQKNQEIIQRYAKKIGREWCGPRGRRSPKTLDKNQIMEQLLLYAEGLEEIVRQVTGMVVDPTTVIESQMLQDQVKGVSERDQLEQMLLETVTTTDMLNLEPLAGEDVFDTMTASSEGDEDIVDSMGQLDPFYICMSPQPQLPSTDWLDTAGNV